MLYCRKNHLKFTQPFHTFFFSIFMDLGGWTQICDFEVLECFHHRLQDMPVNQNMTLAKIMCHLFCTEALITDYSNGFFSWILKRISVINILELDLKLLAFLEGNPYCTTTIDPEIFSSSFSASIGMSAHFLSVPFWHPIYNTLHHSVL